MLSSVWGDLKREYEYGNMVSKLIIMNVTVFFIYHIFKFFIFVITQGSADAAFDSFMNHFCISSDWKILLWQPYSIFTHFFLHFQIGHILWNMVGLYVFGEIVGDLLGDQRVLPLYILGGLAGAAAYMLSIFLPYQPASYALGASASIMAIVVAAGLKAPNYLMRIILIGEVKLKYIVMVMVLLDMIGAQSMSNSGGHIAHLGGALMGFLFINRLNSGYDMSVPINRVLDGFINFFNRLKGQASRSKPTTNNNRRRENNAATREERRPQPTPSKEVGQDKIDAILEKIKQKGYDSLSAEEKEALFKASNK
jgi:membrane associated rhomboid family serine protease